MKTIPEFEPGNSNNVALRCPMCGYSDLHQGKVEVYDRNEDAALVDKTVVMGGHAATARVPNTGSGNPSMRRQGMMIEFQCESCGPMTLNIAQHKGQTYLSWSPSGRPV